MNKECTNCGKDIYVWARTNWAYKIIKHGYKPNGLPTSIRLYFCSNECELDYRRKTNQDFKKIIK